MIGWLLAAQIAVVAHAPGAGTTCAPVEISAAARVAGTVSPRMSLPVSGPVQLLHSSTVSHQETDATGAPYSVTEGTFILAVGRTGRVVVPGVVASLGAHRAVSAPIVLTLRPDVGEPDEPLVFVRAALDDGLTPGSADTLYVGEQADYIVEVLLNEAARTLMRHNPTFFPPDMPAVLAYDVSPPRAEHAAPRCFARLGYRRALFPLFSGAQVIPPASLKYTLPLSPSFFSREDEHEAHTDSVSFFAVEPPLAGRPADFAGAVGNLQASVRLGAPTGRMGDPTVLTVRVEGEGNVKLLPRPTIAIPWATVVTGEERVEVDTSGARVRGAKEFDWLLTPRRAGRLAVPAIMYPYFDPRRETYEVALTAPLEIDVRAASLVASVNTPTPPLGIRTTLGEPQPAPLTDHPAFWLLLALAPVPAALRRVSRVRGRTARSPSAAARLQHAAFAREPLLAREVRRLYLDALRERVPSLVPATQRVPLARQLRRAGVTEPTADAADALLALLDASAFGGAGTIGDAPTAEAVRIAGEIDHQAVRRRTVSGAKTMLVVLLLLSAGGALAALPANASEHFSAGVRAYGAGQFTVAQRQFARAAVGEPRTANAWANLGTAAWATHDSAHAAAGWQRALRLDPLDAESRERLSFIPGADNVQARGYVPPLPLNALAGAALVIWLFAWIALALPPTRRPPMLRPIAGGAIVLAVLMLAGTLELHDRLDPGGLGVVRASGPLRDGPAPDAALTGSAAAGEIGLLGAREGVWVRIELGSARAGWLPTSRILPLQNAGSD